MNSKYVAIGVVVALAAVMVGALAIGSQNAFARNHGGSTDVHQNQHQSCHNCDNNGQNQNQNNNVNGDNEGDNYGNENNFGGHR